jgi:Ca-activated chloride channel homolog
MRYPKRLFVFTFFSLLVLMLLASNLPTSFAQQDRLPPPPPPPPEEKPKQRPRPVDAQQEPEDQSGTIKVDTNLVQVDVSVVDKSNKFIKGLDKSRFQIFEDQILQNIEQFSQEQVPISYGIIVDTSGSMRRRLTTVIKAAKTLINLSRPGDEVFIVDMKDSQNIELLEDYTTNLEDAFDALDNMVSGGGTSLLDGIVVSGEHAKAGKNRRKALVVISDGDERDSTYSVDQTLDKIREYDVQLYLIGFTDDLPEDSGLFKRSPKKKAQELIGKLASESGGQAYFPRELADLETIAQKIGSDLRSQYTIGYYPSNEKKDGTFRRIQVKLLENKEQAAVRTRTGYYAPKEGTANNSSETPRRNGRK